jgi:hypothetical protein
MYGLLTFKDDYFDKSTQHVEEVAKVDMTEVHAQAMREPVSTSSPLE